MLCAIWYHSYYLKNVKNIHGGVIFLVKFQASGCNATKSITPLWMFSRFFELYKWYQIAQSVSYDLNKWAQMVTACMIFQCKPNIKGLNPQIHVRELGVHRHFILGKFCATCISVFFFQEKLYSETSK